MDERVTDARIDNLLRRYGGADFDGLQAVLCPLLLPIESLDKKIIKLTGQSHYRASFTVRLTEETRVVLCRGRTGKFVPSAYGSGGDGGWKEIAKGRIIEVDNEAGLAHGEIYTGGNKAKLEAALKSLSADDLLEIDQFGAAAKVLSGLAEHALMKHAQERGYDVYRMPEDMARHLGHYANYDFDFEKDDVRKRIEVKSIWGTNTEYARLIHSTTTRPRGDEAKWTAEQRANYYPTSSCKFSTQDIFAVSLFLRTGRIEDFAFARSVSNSTQAHGLPSSTNYPEHVHQNPRCTLGDGSWFPTIDDVWDLP